MKLKNKIIKFKNPVLRYAVLLFYFAFCGLLSAQNPAQKITLTLQNVTIKEFIKEIESKTKYSVVYRDLIVNEKGDVTVNVVDKPLTELLKSVLDPIGLKATFNSKTIVLTEKPRTNQLNKEDKKITGVVIDAEKSPIVGGLVKVIGSKQVTVTDIDGYFTLNVPENASLSISYIGYQTQVVSVSGKTNLNIQLVTDDKLLDEIVVVGYGSVKKSDLTGSVASISRKDLGDRQVSGLGDLIQGRAAGVDVVSGQIRVRGVTSFYNTDPLIVIDGMADANYDALNANDIENIEILKDASSTAIYGARGANGVVLITTKSGKEGPLKINATAFTGFSTRTKKIDVLNASQYTDYFLDALKNSGQPVPAKFLTPAVRQDVTDWQDAIYRVAHKNEVNVDLLGGSKNATFFLSLGLRTDQPIVGNNQDNSYTIKNKNTFTPFKWLKLGTNISAQYSTSIGGGGTNLDWALNAPPYAPILDPSNLGGYWNPDREQDLNSQYNPLTGFNNSDNHSSKVNYQANGWAEIEPIKGLVYRFQGGINGDFHTYNWWGESTRNGGVQVNPNGLTDIMGFGFYPTYENTLTYKKTLGKHDISAMVGNAVKSGQFSREIGIYSKDYVDTNVHNYLYATTSQVEREKYSKFGYLSYFGRLNYQYDNKYLLTVNLRSDASPRFAPQNRWGTFPSVSLAWKLHEEKFIKDLNIFDQFKVRAGWGISGNDDIGDFKYVSQVFANGVYYPIGAAQDPFHGATIRDNSVQDIRWASTESKSIGVDLSFLKSKLNVSTDYFIKNTNDILFPVPQPASLGYGGNGGGDAIVNAASCENKGVEFSVGYRNSVNKLNYSVNVNYTYVDNVVTSLGAGQPFFDGISRTEKGQPIGYFYGFTADGIFSTQAQLDAANQAARNAALQANPALTANDLKAIYYQQAETRPGDVRFKDLDGDGKVSFDKDRAKIGSPIPKHYFGLNISLDYKGFDFNTSLSGVAGTSIYNEAWSWLSGGVKTLNQSTAVLNRWRSEAEPGNGVQPRAVFGDPAQNTRPSTNNIENGDFLKIRLISLGYILPMSLTTKLGIEKVRFYASANNYFTFTGYKGVDPEFAPANYDNRNLGRGRDTYQIRAPKSLVFGLQFGF